MAGQLARHVELLETVCRTGSYKEIGTCAKQTVGLLLRAASQDGIRDVAGSSSNASDQLMLKLFLGARVALERLQESRQGKHLSQHEDMRCVNALLAVCKVVLKAYFSGKGPLLHEVAREQILKSGFLPSFAATCSAVAESLTWHAQAVSTSDCTYSTSQAGQGSSSRVAGGVKACKATGGEADTAVQLAEFSDDLMSLWAQLNLVICRVHHPKSRNTTDISTQAWLLYDPAFIVTMAPVSALALAVLRFLSNYSYNSNSSGSPVPSLLLGACSISHYCCYSLDLEIKQAMQLNAWEGARPHPTAAAVCKAIQSTECQNLYLIELAARLLQVQQKVYPGGKFSGSSKEKKSCKKQQQQMPALQPVIELNGPQTVLQLLGISERVVQQFAHMMSTYEFNGKDVPVVGDFCAALSNLERSITLSKNLPMINITGTLDSSSSRSKICTEATIQLHAALLHTLCLALPLVPLPDTMNSCMSCMEAIGSVHYGWISLSSTKRELTVVTAAVNSNLLTSILSVGGPAVLQMLQGSSKSRDELLVPVTKMLAYAMQLTAVNDFQLIRVIGESTSSAQCGPAPYNWSEAWKQQPLHVLATVEAAARSAAEHSSAMVAHMTMIRQVFQAIADNTELMKTAVAAGEISVSSSNKLEKCSVSDSNLAPSLISCMTSCLKFTASFMRGGYGNMAALQCAIDIAAIAEKAVAAAAGSAHQDRYAGRYRSSTTAATAAIVPWLHVFARALYCCSSALLWPHVANTAADKEAWLQDVKQAKENLAKAPRWAAKPQAGDSKVTDTLLASQQAANTGQLTDKQRLSALSDVLAYSYFGPLWEGHSWLELPCMLKQLFTATESCNRYLQHAVPDSCQDLDTDATPWSFEKAAALDQKYVQLDVGFEQAWEVCMGMVRGWAQHNPLTNPKPITSWMAYLYAREALGYDISLQLQQYAADLVAVLPTRLCCNNPKCSNVGAAKPLQQHMLSELACVGQRKCSRCEAAGYCSKQCQAEHWKQHKVTCRRLCRDDRGKDQ